MAALSNRIKGKGVWFWAAVSVLLVVTVLFSSQAFSASMSVTAQPLQNAGNGDLTYTSDYSGASAIVTRHESADLTLNGSDQITTVTVQGNKASGGADVQVDILDASATLLDTATIALPSAAGAYNTAVTLGSGTVVYHTVTTVSASYTATGAPAVAVNGAISTANTEGPPSSWSHTVGAGSNRLLVVAISESDKGATPSGVTFGAAAMTPGPAYSNDKTAASLWYLKDPAVSTDTITATYSGDPAVDFIGGAINFINVDQTTPVSGSTGAKGQGSSGSVNVTSATDDMVVSVWTDFERTVSANGTPTPTVHWDLEGGGKKAYGIGTT